MIPDRANFVIRFKDDMSFFIPARDEAHAWVCLSNFERYYGPVVSVQAWPPKDRIGEQLEFWK